jgi:hypothetical protein
MAARTGRRRRSQTRFGNIQGVRQRMGTVSVEEDWIIVFLSQASHQSGYLPYAEKFPLSLGGADSDRDFEVPRGGHHRFQYNKVRNIEVADRHSVLPTLLQSFSQTLHAGRSFWTSRYFAPGLLMGIKSTMPL